MKTGMLVLVFLLISKNHLQAWEFEGNPDRMPSIGVGISNTDIHGSRTGTSLPHTQALVVRDEGGSDSYAYGLDLRLPVSHQATISLSYELIETNSNFTRDLDVYRESQNLNGQRWGIGARFYLR